MSDDATDVTKALAAFGAPSIRYHSFGQAQIKPSSVVLPRRAAPAALEGFVTRPEEMPAPEPALVMAPRPVPVVPPMDSRPAPVMRQAEPVPPPTVAPPPRPLAEWAAPAGLAPPRPAPVRPVAAAAAVPSIPTPPSMVPPSFPAPAHGPVALTAPVVMAPQHDATMPVPSVPTPPPIGPAAAAAAIAPPIPARVAPAPRAVAADDLTMSNKGAPSGARRNLEDIFELLAGG